MAVAIVEIAGGSPVVPHSDGDNWEIRGGLAFTANYPATGETSFKTEVEALLKQLGFGAIDFVVANGVPGYLVQYNYETGRLQVFEGAAGVLKEFTAGAYAGAITGAKPRFYVMGR